MEQRVYFKYLLVGLITTYIILQLSAGMSSTFFSSSGEGCIVSAICIVGGIIISCTFAVIDTLYRIFQNKNNDIKK
ncbi:hypothetical protein D2962_01570 [Biomaibacter acetigenes]|jgi:hypothetical protein|uniref:Uncharacterized protein n=1 Tax=Biomaibacter acetigenes TaxID=2316383 RepID=A0A3G2R1Z8_9FIRM|nr:hypothetical protein D2962_01570 [Biomaibacter acetigenes]MCR4431214.1 hypothetical protein [Tepidanaerobacteraceae bacterium]RKL61294.1 hypothetical protein DXT63_17520 [Thermoanaerobacteraceae bacterium SP2]